MALLNKTPMARKEALGYCRRCLAVMLCCVLVFGLTIPAVPRAQASITDCAIIGMSGTGGGATWGATTPGGMAWGDPVGACIAQVAMLGSDAISSFICGYAQGGPNTKYYGSAGYEAGAACWDYLYNLGGDIGAWCATTAESFKSKGGVSPGDTIRIPKDVAQAVQQWTKASFGFVGDSLSFDDDFLLGENDIFVLTKVDSSALEAYTSSSDKGFLLPLERVGQLVPFYLGDLSESYTHSHTVADKLVFTSTYILSESKTGASFNLKVNFKANNFYSGPKVWVGPSGSYGAFDSFESLKEQLLEDAVATSATLFYCNGRIYAGTAYVSDNFVEVFSSTYVSLDKLKRATASTTVTKSSAIDTPVSEERVVVVPQDLPTTEINGKTVPVFDDVQATDVIAGGIIDDPAVPSAVPTTAPGITAGEISGAIADALPVTGAKVGDQVVGEVMADPDSLGAVFVSKFPFSIPWDIVKAIKLLAAPPVTPRWELDFMQPIAYRVGGFRGDTKLVLDMSEYEIVGIATRWVSTLFFVYALASGTKKLMWTA